MNLREFLASRDLTQEAAGVLGDVDASTISLIMNGKAHASPRTVVKLARALGVAAKRMQAICEQSWAEAHPEEVLAG